MQSKLLQLVLAIMIATPIVAQQESTFEYGSIEELRGVKKIFIDAREDLDLRDIIKTILEKNLDVAVVERPEDADHVIFFTWWDAGPTWRARAVVAKRIQPDRFRILSNYRGKEAELNDMADEYAKWLVKQLRRSS
jgi:hypothetical protein